MSPVLRTVPHRRGRRLYPGTHLERLRADSPHRPSSRPRHPGRRPGEVFKSGEMVRETGIYQVLHHRAHRQPHDVVMLAGDAFPPCETCQGGVRFRLVRTAPYIFQDQDFEHPDE